MLLGIPNKNDGEGSKIANYRGIGLSEMIIQLKKSKSLDVLLSYHCMFLRLWKV